MNLWCDKNIIAKPYYFGGSLETCTNGFKKQPFWMDFFLPWMVGIGEESPRWKHEKNYKTIEQDVSCCFT